MSLKQKNERIFLLHMENSEKYKAKDTMLKFKCQGSKSEILHINIDEVRTMYRDKVSYGKIAAYFKIENGRSVVAGFINRWIKEPDSYEVDIRGDIIDQYVNHYKSLTYLSEKFDISKSRVRGILEEHGLKVRTVMGVKKPKAKKVVKRKKFNKVPSKDKKDSLESRAISEEADTRYAVQSLPKRGQCKYAVGSSYPFSWCQEQATNGVYCQYHWDACHDKKSSPLVVLERTNFGAKFNDF